MKEKNPVYKLYWRFNRDMLLSEKFKVLQNQLNLKIENPKQMYYTILLRKWANLATS